MEYLTAARCVAQLLVYTREGKRQDTANSKAGCRYLWSSADNLLWCTMHADTDCFRLVLSQETSATCARQAPSRFKDTVGVQDTGYNFMLKCNDRLTVIFKQQRYLYFRPKWYL